MTDHPKSPSITQGQLSVSHWELKAPGKQDQLVNIRVKEPKEQTQHTGGCMGAAQCPNIYQTDYIL